MLKQYPDFDVKHFGSTFYGGKVNGFDIMVMQSSEDADRLIEEMKQIIDSYKAFPQQEINLEYDDSHLLEPDKIRVKRAIKKYASQKFGKPRCI